MTKENLRIEVVSSSKIWLSSMSQVSRAAICVALSNHYTSVRVRLVDNLSDLEVLVASKPDLVFLGMSFVPVGKELGLQESNKVWISQYFDDHGIAYTGSSVRAYQLEQNKALAKQCVLDAGLQTAPFFVIKQTEAQISQPVGLKYPLFIKPVNRGGGVGIGSDSVANDFEQLQTKVRAIATNYQADSLVEECLPGREFSVAILKNEYDQKMMIMPIELTVQPDKNGMRILGKRVKSSNLEVAAKVTDKIIKQQIETLAIEVFNALGGRDYGRIDIRLDKFGTPQFLEANLIPSLISGYGSFPKAFMLNIGMGYEQMVLSIARLGLARNENVPEGQNLLATESIAVLPTLEAAFEVA